jgi:hypothetical protein
MNIVAVPIRVDALVADKEECVVGAGADFAQLPYRNASGIDVHTDRPFIASSVARKAFNNLSHLPRGIHLHWSLPDAMTKGEVKDDKIELPKVPDRWLVCRVNKKGVVAGKAGVTEKRWIVESDFLYPEGVTPRRAICIPNRDNSQQQQKDEQLPYRYMGRQLTLKQWRQEKEHGIKHEYLSGLHAVGWGTPYFSALYTECFSVFGAYDEDIDADDVAGGICGYSYEVYG